MSASADTMIPSTQRAIPLQMREDLRIARIEYRGVGSWVIKDPVGLKYHRLQSEQHHVLKLLDGERSLEEIRDALKLEFPMVKFALPDVQNLISDLHQKGLAQSNRAGQGPSLIKQFRKQRRAKMLGAIKNVMYLRLPGWDPERTLTWLYPYVRWLYRPWAVAAAILLACASMILLAVQFETFYSRLPGFQQFFGWPNLIYLWMTLGIAKVIHEFGHGVSCTHFGGECHEMGVMLLVFSPCLYCDVTDSWMLKNKWSRIVIAAAGMYIEVIISSIAIFLWWNTQPGLLNYLCLNIFFVTAVTTVIFNANPLMRFDGYYMLSDFLEIPNLRPKADKYLSSKFAWYCLGIEIPPDPFLPDTGRVWFGIFAVAAAVYRWFIVFGITLFLYTVLKPYNLQSIGIAMAVVSVVSIVGSMGKNVYKIIAAPRAEPMSIRKISISVAVLLTVIVSGLLIPLPLNVEAAFLVQPQGIRHVYTRLPGRLVEMKVEPGSRVIAGETVMARLMNAEKEDRYRTLKIEEKAQQIEVTTARALGDFAGAQLAGRKLRNIREQVADYEDQIRHLQIIAPLDGIVVPPPKIEAPKMADTKNQLATWYGTPLDKQNQNCYLEERTHLLSIAPNDSYEAVLVVDQGDRDRLEVDQPVQIKFDHLPTRIYNGTISSISPQEMKFAPKELSNKYGGELATVTDDHGREQLLSTAYPATVNLTQDTNLLRPGMRGKVRFVVEDRSAFEWIYRYFRRTFHFHL